MEEHNTEQGLRRHQHRALARDGSALRMSEFAYLVFDLFGKRTVVSDAFLKIRSELSMFVKKSSDHTNLRYVFVRQIREAFKAAILIKADSQNYPASQ
jgi:hypothetical protein